MRILLIAFLLFVAPVAAQEEVVPESAGVDLTITGASQAFVGDPVVLTVNGLPEIDTSQSIDAALEWTNHLKFIQSSTEAATTTVQPQLIVRLTNEKAFILEIVVSTNVEGTVVVVGDYNQQPFQAALHRIEFVNKEPPPNVGLVATAQINKAASPVQVSQGDQVLYTFNLQTDGDRPVKDLTYESLTGLVLIGPTGDVNENSILDVSETWQYSALALAKAGSVTETTTFSGEADKYAVRTVVKSTYNTNPTPTPPIPPNPIPDPDPVVEPGPRWILIVHEIQDGDPAFQDLLTDIREHNNTDDNDHTLVIVDDDINNADGSVPDWYKPYADLLKEKDQSLPAIIITDDKGKLIKIEDLPSDLDGYKTLITSAGG